MSTEAENVQYGIEQMNSQINGIAAQIGTKNEMKRAQKYNLETMAQQNEYQNAFYEKQRDDAYERENFLNLNSKSMEVQALRNAGINPSWAQDSAGNVVSSSVGAPSQGSAPSGSGIHPSGATSKGIEAYLATMQQGLQMRMQEAQINNLDAQTGKLKSETAQVDINTSFLGDTYQDRKDDISLGNQLKSMDLKLSKEDLEVKQRLNTYYNDHPESFAAIQDAQIEMNKNLGKMRELMDVQKKQTQAGTNKINKEIELLDYDEYFKQAETAFTTAQMEVLRDRNFQEHFNDPSWLLREIEYAQNDNADPSEIALLRQCYDEISGKQSQLREFKNKEELQKNELDFKYVQLGEQAFTDVLHDIRKMSRNGHRNRSERINGKKNNHSKNRTTVFD